MSTPAIRGHVVITYDVSGNNSAFLAELTRDHPTRRWSRTLNGVLLPESTVVKDIHDLVRISGDPNTAIAQNANPIGRAIQNAQAEFAEAQDKAKVKQTLCYIAFVYDGHYLVTSRPIG